MIPKYVGPCAFGIKMGLVLQGTDLLSEILHSLQDVEKDGFLSDNDVLCVTESIVARAQNNYITTKELSREFQNKLSLTEYDKVGVLFPITSRNRFALILEGIAASVPRGEVIVQFSYPDDEVGNQIVPPEIARELEKKTGGCFSPFDFKKQYLHPLTGMDYTQLYREIITQIGAEARIVLCNQAEEILKFEPDAVIAADIHTREQTKSKLLPSLENVITLQEIFNSSHHHAWSEWGLLGSNMASGGKLKLAPRESDAVATKLQSLVREKFRKNIEVIIYGDGAYKDPTSGIYELADPCAAFGTTSGLNNILRRGIKLKYMVDLYQEQGKSEKQIQEILSEETKKNRKLNCTESEGTTPRRIEDLLASLADLVSGSADAGTPLVLAKGFLDK